MFTKLDFPADAIGLHLQELGIRETPPQEHRESINQAFPEELAEDFWQAWERAEAGRGSKSDLYKLITHLAQYLAYTNLEGEGWLKQAEWLIERAFQSADSGDFLIDLGCGAGVLTDALARVLADCRICGVDRTSNLIEIAQAEFGRENLQFLNNCYAEPANVDQFAGSLPAANTLVSLQGIDFPSRNYATPLLGSDYRAWPEYQLYAAIANPILQSWRELAATCADLFVTTQVPSIAALLAITDAAIASGWRIDVPSCATLATTNSETERGTHVGFHMIADYGERPDDAELIALLVPEQSNSLLTNPIREPLALITYDQLADRTVLIRQKHQFANGTEICCEIGIVGIWAYRFNRSTQGFQRLEIRPRRELNELNIEFHCFPEERDE